MSGLYTKETEKKNKQYIGADNWACTAYSASCNFCSVSVSVLPLPLEETSSIPQGDLLQPVERFSFLEENDDVDADDASEQCQKEHMHSNILPEYSKEEVEFNHLLRNIFTSTLRKDSIPLNLSPPTNNWTEREHFT